MSDIPDHPPRRRFSPNFPDGRNSNVPNQGPPRGEYSRSHPGYHDALQGETTHTSYGVSHGNIYPQAFQSSSLQPGTPTWYDTTPRASQPPPIPPRPRTESVRIDSVQSADSLYPLGFVCHQSVRHMTLAGPSSQGSGGTWNPLPGPYSQQSTSESHPPYNAGGFRFDCQQDPRPIAAAPPSQGPTGVQNARVPFSQVTTMAAKKRALVIDTNHPLHLDHRYRLEVCIRDSNANRVADFLHNERGIARNNIHIITDGIPGDLPTRDNILKAMKTLVRGAQPGDEFVVCFSGRGIQIQDTDGHESDRLHEGICAIDYRGDHPHQDCNTPGLILDDTMYELMVKPLPPQCRLTAVFDCRHSGTALDLSAIVSDILDHSPSRSLSPNFPDGNSNVPNQGPPRDGYSRSHRDCHDALQGGISPTSYGASQSLYPQAFQSSSLQPGTAACYDTAPHASQPPPIPPRPPTEFARVDSIQSADSPYPLGFVQSARQMTLAGPSSQGSGGAWNPGSYPQQSTSESHSPYNPGGFRVVRQQNTRPITATPPPQGPPGVQYPCVEISQVYFKFTFLRRSLPVDNWSTMTAKKRKALVIGINYSEHADRKFRLRHGTGDAYTMASFLSSNLAFAIDDIRVMTDDMENPWDRPTKENILREMRELVRDPQPGDSFFLYFSGHGMQIDDWDGDEDDGLDECICAMDYYGDDEYPTANTPGLIVDDEIHDILVQYLPPQCRLTVLFDSCHSGTALDLPYVYDSNGVVKPLIHPQMLRVLHQKASYADVVSLSASMDSQGAKETDSGGALRCAFIDSMMEFDNTLSYKALIRSVLDYMGRHWFTQKPQLSTSYEIDTDLPFIV